MLLKNLLKNENWDFILLKDALEQSGRTVLKALLKDLLSCSSWHFHIFCYDKPPSYYETVFTNFSSRIHYYDIHSDPMGWLHSKKTNLLDYKAELTDVAVRDFAEHSVLVFDSLTTLLLHHSYFQIYRMLHHLKRTGSFKLMCLLHQDCHDEVVLNSIELLSSTIIEMLFNKIYCESKSMCSIIHKKTSGKILKEINTFKITEEFSLTDNEKFSSNTQKSKSSLQNNPTEGLTFKLSLEDNEQQARSQLILPYTKVKGQGYIVYEPDVNDDFDDEDPDDDLNI